MEMLAQICAINLSFGISNVSYCHAATLSHMYLLDPASYLHKLYGNHMASDKALICGLGGNAKTTVTDEMSYIY